MKHMRLGWKRNYSDTAAMIEASNGKRRVFYGNGHGGRQPDTKSSDSKIAKKLHKWRA